MKASELRIGNLLRDKVTKTELKVIKLTEKDIVTFVIDRSKFPLQDGWGIEPIPLTEEWLFKLGFETDHIEWWNGIICLGIFKDGIYYLPTDQISFRIGKEIEYVHQLQNLYFALTGEELILN
jgi:hypothetical protein